MSIQQTAADGYDWEGGSPFNLRCFESSINASNSLRRVIVCRSSLICWKEIYFCQFRKCKRGSIPRLVTLESWVTDLTRNGVGLEPLKITLGMKSQLCHIYSELVLKDGKGSDEHVWVVFSRDLVRTFRSAVARLPSSCSVDTSAEAFEAIIVATRRVSKVD